MSRSSRKNNHNLVNKLKKRRLVFLDESPDYCRRNATAGFPGKILEQFLKKFMKIENFKKLTMSRSQILICHWSNWQNHCKLPWLLVKSLIFIFERFSETQNLPFLFIYRLWILILFNFSPVKLHYFSKIKPQCLKNYSFSSFGYYLFTEVDFT